MYIHINIKVYVTQVYSIVIKETMKIKALALYIVYPCNIQITHMIYRYHMGDIVSMVTL